MPSCAYQDRGRFEMQSLPRCVRTLVPPALDERGTILPFPRPRPAADPAALIRTFLEQAGRAEVRTIAGTGTGAVRQARPLHRITLSTPGI